MDLEKLIQRYLDPAHREIEPKQGDIGASIARVKSIDESARTVTAIVSTPHIDRYEEIVEPKAFERHLPTFMANPVFVAGHTYTGTSGEATVIGHWQSVRITSEGLIATAQFADTPLARDYWQLYLGGHMKAFSVGWITHESEMRDFETPESGNKKKRLRVFTEVELIEISAVAIPANRQSLVRAASALGQVRGEPDELMSDELVSVLLSDDVIKQLCDAVEPAVRDAIRKELNTDPGGRLQDFIEEVVESCMRHPDHGDHDHPPRKLGDDGDVAACPRTMTNKQLVEELRKIVR